MKHLFFNYYGWRIQHLEGLYTAWPPINKPNGYLLQGRTQVEIKRKIKNHFARWGW